MSEVIKITETLIESKIYFIRGQKVMLDNDLAEMYGVEQEHLNKQLSETLTGFLKILCLR